MMQKRFILAIALVACFTGVYAQKNEDKLVRFGIRAGVNFQKLYGDGFDGKNADYDFLTGYHAGVTADLLVTPTFYIQPGLLYSVKGAKSESNSTEVTHKASYVELPINFLFKPALGNGRLVLGAGPYAAYGISGKLKAKTGNNSIELDAKFKNNISAADYINDKYYYIRPFDFGANALAGYELNNGFSIQVNGQLGLYKVNPAIDGVLAEVDNTSLKNWGVGVSLGYKF